MGKPITNMKNVKTKDFQEAPGDEAAVEVTEDVAADEPAEEKFSAQILRRIHEHHSLLMQEYDELAQMNEHEEIGEFVTKLLGGFEETLTAVEELFEKHHGDLPPLEGAMGDEGEKDMAGDEDEATEADSEKEELPTPDEVVEGMETKSLKNGKQTKVIPVARRKDIKALDWRTVKAKDVKVGDILADSTASNRVTRISRNQDGSLEFYTNTDHFGPYEPNEDVRVREASKGLITARRKDMTQDEADKIADDIKKEAADTEEKHLCAACKAAEGELTDDTLPGTPGDEAAAPPVGADETTNAPGTDLGEEARVKSWLDEHRPTVGDSAVYLKGVSETQDFNDDSRHEAYHHGVMLDKMCKAFPQMEKIDQMSEVQAGKASQDARDYRRQFSVESMDGGRYYVVKGPKTPHDNEFRSKEAAEEWIDRQVRIRYGDKSFPAMDEQAGACNITHPHYKACSGAGAFLKELSNCHDFGMPHQEKALAWHKELDAMNRQDEVAEVGQGDNPVPLGEMQEKNGIGNAEAFPEMDKQDDEVDVTEKQLTNGKTKSLAEAFIRAKEEQDEELKQMKELSRKLAAVAGKL